MRSSESTRSRRRRRTRFVALAFAALAGCASLEGLGGDSTVGGPTVEADASVVPAESSTESGSPPTVTAADAASPSFCGAKDASFCEDFDRSDWLAHFDARNVADGAALDPVLRNDAPSAPNALRLFLPEHPNGIVGAHATKTFAASKVDKSKLTITVKVHPPASFAELSPGWGILHVFAEGMTYGCGVSLGTEGVYAWSFQDELGAPRYPTPRVAPRGWFTVDATVDLATAKTTLAIDGVPVLTQASAFDPQDAKKVSVSLGSGSQNDPRATELFFDDLVVRRE